jgi:hypothetical protein
VTPTKEYNEYIPSTTDERGECRFHRFRPLSRALQNLSSRISPFLSLTLSSS